LSEYFEGRRTRFDLTYAPVGTPFQQKIWALLLAIPFGQTRSYGDLARAAGSPSAARAVGAANGANPICVFIPCHRVIGANGTLTGFAFGEDCKRRLLALEGAWELPGLVAPAAAS
jgi:methylated-DNA-[protein]-cysteine S-methyltransferase